MPEALVEFRHVSFSYDGVRPVLDDLSFTVSRGEFICLLGGNGSGKSTFAKHVNGLLVPDSGDVRVLGRLTSDENWTYFIRENVGLAFQNPDDQLVASVVENDVAFGPENLGVPACELRERVVKALDAVELQGFERCGVNALSGGQKQRVAIAGVLAMNPTILVLDEATAMLDPRGRRSLLHVVRKLHDEGMTIIMITHFMEEAVYADRVVVLDGGRIRLDGSPQDVLTMAECLSEMNLDVPFACRLSLLLQKRGVAVSTCITDTALKEELCTLRSKR